jgi:NAD(P)-dependent dehydrogenase (short-subunit alcohol dehydrogenase family)
MQIITGKTALVTGGTKGIGFGIAAEMVKAGMRVAITGRTAAAVESAAAALRAIDSGEVMGLVADVRDETAMEAAVEQLRGAWGSLDVLIANAGLGHFGSIETMSQEQWRETMDVNLTGVFNSVKAAIPALKLSQGYIMTIASLAGTNFFAGGAAYNASKFGLVGFTQAIMLDLRKYGIRVTTIMPGSVTSHFNNHEPSEADAWKIQPEDIGQMVVDLLRLHPRTLPSKIEVRPTMPR